MLGNMSDYLPKFITCWREGFNRKQIISDLIAGISVGVIALPLAIAFAIASGVTPEKGLYTAIIAGFLISLLGGSRVQIGGPTGAFVVIIYATIQRHGYEGLALATLIAGILMIAMGVARFGILLKFIPFSVTTGFTTGIALVILISQIKDFFGLALKNVPPNFVDKCVLLCLHAYTWSPWATAISIGTLLFIFGFRAYWPQFPGVIVAIIIAAFTSFAFGLPVETISSTFGEIPRTLPMPTFPHLTLESVRAVFPDAISIALLGAIESLLSAIVADGMTGHRHRSNCELVAQGLANMGSILFGGIPATGAIARTSANIRLGAKTPIAGMTHAVTLLVLMIAFAPYAGLIPLAALSAVLVYIAWNMSELPNFITILKGPRGDAVILLLTFLLTVIIDLTVAVQVGVLLAAVLFLKKMTDTATVKICTILAKENAEEHPDKRDEEILFREDVPEDTTVFEIKGPFFYAIANLLDEALLKLEKTPRFFILRMRSVPMIDATGIQALKAFSKKCHKKGITLLISGARKEIVDLFAKSGLEQDVGKEHFFPNIDAALAFVKEYEKQIAHR